MFFGTYYHQMDSKKRIRIPSRFSKELGTTYVVGKSSVKGVLSVYTLETFAEVSKKRHSIFNREAEKAYTLFFGTYFEVKEDGQGRLLLTEPIRKMVDLGEKDLVSVGAQDHINLMSRETYDNLYTEMSFEAALDILQQQYDKSADDNK